jgi:hypothetical protein
MSKKIHFEYIVAESGAGPHNHMFSLDREHDDFDCHASCILWNNITFHGVPDDLSDTELEDINNGDYTKTVKIGSIFGCLILCKQMLMEGQDPWEICDDENGDLEYTLSALKGPEGPLNEEDGDPWLDIYYIHEWKMERGYNTASMKSKLLDLLPNITLMLFHVKPDILAYFPSPLKYEPDPNEQARQEALGKIISQKMETYFENIIDQDSSKKESNVRNFSEAYVLSEDEINYFLGRKQSGPPYPESAKNRKEFSFFEGFEEAGDSYLLYKYVTIKNGLGRI